MVAPTTQSDTHERIPSRLTIKFSLHRTEDHHIRADLGSSAREIPNLFVEKAGGSTSCMTRNRVADGLQVSDLSAMGTRKAFIFDFGPYVPLTASHGLT